MIQKGGAVIDDTFGGADELCLDPQVLDQKTADQRAIDILELNNRNYVTGNGATYGNPEIRAGKIIKSEGLGEKFSGKYFVISAKHELVPLRGYRTSFSFISSLGTPVQAGAGAGGAAAQQFGEPGGKEETQAAAGAGTEDEQEEEKEPKIINLKWMKDGEEISNAVVEDSVLITADVQNLNDGTRVTISIWEKDAIGNDDLIKNFSVYIKDGKIKKEWIVEYHEDIDDIESQQEQNEKGYTLPEYVFKIKTISNPEIESGESPLLEVVDWIDVTLKDKETEEVLADTKFYLMKNGETLYEGKTDKNGFSRIENLCPGKYDISLEEGFEII